MNGIITGMDLGIGLAPVALKCPSCVSVVLSNAYWTIKTVLVEESSKIAEILINKTREVN